MAKNKLLTIPIEEEKRERLNRYCGDRGKTVSQMITGFIDRLLDGSIDPSTSIESSRPPIEIDMGEIVAEVWNRLHELPSPSMDSPDVILRMSDIEADIKRLRGEMDKVLIKNGTYPVQTIDKSSEPYTLEDTKTYLKDKFDYNRSRERRSDRITQPAIAIHLLTYGYPHPSNKKWNRDEVRDVCKLWGLNI